MNHRPVGVCPMCESRDGLYWSTTNGRTIVRCENHPPEYSGMRVAGSAYQLKLLNLFGGFDAPCVSKCPECGSEVDEFCSECGREAIVRPKDSGRFQSQPNRRKEMLLNADPDEWP